MNGAGLYYFCVIALIDLENEVWILCSMSEICQFIKIIYTISLNIWEIKSFRCIYIYISNDTINFPNMLLLNYLRSNICHWMLRIQEIFNLWYKCPEICVSRRKIGCVLLSNLYSLSQQTCVQLQLWCYVDLIPSEEHVSEFQRLCQNIYIVSALHTTTRFEDTGSHRQIHVFIYRHILKMVCKIIIIVYIKYNVHTVQMYKLCIHLHVVYL